MENRNENRNEMIVKLSERPGETIRVIKSRNYTSVENKKVKKNKKSKSKKTQRKSANSPRKSTKSPKKNKKKRTKNYRRN